MYIMFIMVVGTTIMTYMYLMGSIMLSMSITAAPPAIMTAKLVVVLPAPAAEWRPSSGWFIERARRYLGHVGARDFHHPAGKVPRPERGAPEVYPASPRGWTGRTWAQFWDSLRPALTRFLGLAEITDNLVSTKQVLLML